MNTDELIEHVTNDLIAAIENGADTWQMPWHTIATNAQPRSIDDRPYRGLNAVVLALTAAANGWPSGTWRPIERGNDTARKYDAANVPRTCCCGSQPNPQPNATPRPTNPTTPTHRPHPAADWCHESSPCSPPNKSIAPTRH